MLKNHSSVLMQLLVYGFEAFCKLITTNIVKQINGPIQIGIDFEIVPICGFHFPPSSPQEGRTNGLNF